MKSAFKTDILGQYAELKVDEVKDYGNDFTAELGSDTIVSSVWITSLTTSTPSITGAITSVFFSGAVDGESYWVDNRIVTAGGRTIKESFRLIGKSRTP